MLSIALATLSPAWAAPLEVVVEGTVEDGTIDATDVSAYDVEAILTFEDTLVANSDGVFFFAPDEASLVVDFSGDGPGFSLLLDQDEFSVFAAAFTGNGFFVNQAAYDPGLGFVLGETYVSEPADDFSDSSLYPYGAHALIDDGGAFIADFAVFAGGVAAVDLTFHRIHVRVPDFYEDTIDAYYGSDIIDEGAGFNRRPSTIDANIDQLDTELTAAGCFVDVGDPIAGAYNKAQRMGEGMLGDAVDLMNVGGRNFEGTIGGSSVTGVQNRKHKVVAVDGSDLIAGYWQRTAGKRGFWYAVTVTGCDLEDVQPWYGGNLDALD